MEFITNSYHDSDEEEDISRPGLGAGVVASSSLQRPVVCSAPTISTALVVASGGSRVIQHGENSIASIMLAPEQGPKNPFNPTGGITTQSRSGMGFIEATFMEDIVFNNSYQSYLREDTEKDAVPAKKKAKKSKKDISDLLEGLQDEGDEGDGNPWLPEPAKPAVEPPAGVAATTDSSAGLEEGSTKDNKKTGTTVQTPDIVAALNDPTMFIVEPDLEDEKWEKVNERKVNHLLPPRPARGSVAAPASSTFHGEAERDYQGRSWNLAPAGTRPGDNEHECFIPKKCIHRFLGHSKGVQAIEIFPTTGHLLLSCSMDGKCKVWDVLGDRGLRRTYSGHSEAVRSISLNNTGSQFLSSGYDRYLRLWDVETGRAVATFSNRKMHYQVKFNPKDNDSFICASSDNRLYQWDARSGSIVQEYNYHLQAVNTVTIFDDGRKFVSTSDDKKLLVWEYGIPVPIKYIQEPGMQSIPSVSLHPSGEYFAGQSMDNSIVVYQCGERVRQMRKRVFRGHNNSGYACQISFSPNGKFIVSGDGHGKLHFWDWKTTKAYRKLQVHDNGPCIGTAWHPIVPSWVFTCGWDGQIKLWD